MLLFPMGVCTFADEGKQELAPEAGDGGDGMDGMETCCV